LSVEKRKKKVVMGKARFGGPNRNTGIGKGGGKDKKLSGRPKKIGALGREKVRR